jgi:hypothetical protein
MTTDTSIIDQLSPEDAAALKADMLRQKAETDRTAAQEAERVKERIFKSRSYSTNMYTATGTRITFVNHMHITNIPEVITYLENEIKRGLKDVYVDKNEVYFDPDEYDPAKKAYKQARKDIEAEYAARLAAVTDPTRQIGDSVQQKFTPASTSDIASVAAGSGPISSGLTAKLAMLKVPGK